MQTRCAISPRSTPRGAIRHVIRIAAIDGVSASAASGCTGFL